MSSDFKITAPYQNSECSPAAAFNQYINEKQISLMGKRSVEIIQKQMHDNLDTVKKTTEAFNQNRCPSAVEIITIIRPIYNTTFLRIASELRYLLDFSDPSHKKIEAKKSLFASLLQDEKFFSGAQTEELLNFWMDFQPDEKKGVCENGFHGLKEAVNTCMGFSVGIVKTEMKQEFIEKLGQVVCKCLIGLHNIFIKHHQVTIYERQMDLFEKECFFLSDSNNVLALETDSDDVREKTYCQELKDSSFEKKRKEIKTYQKSTHIELSYEEYRTGIELEQFIGKDNEEQTISIPRLRGHINALLRTIYGSSEDLNPNRNLTFFNLHAPIEVKKIIRDLESKTIPLLNKIIFKKNYLISINKS